jgi:hypothetical protein
MDESSQDASNESSEDASALSSEELRDHDDGHEGDCERREPEQAQVEQFDRQLHGSKV